MCRRERAYDSKDIWRRGQDLRQGIGESHPLAQYDGLEVSQAVDRGGADKVLDAEDDELPIEQHLQVLFERRVNKVFDLSVPRYPGPCNILLSWRQPFSTLGKFNKKPIRHESGAHRHEAFDNEDPPPP